jgi:hypothetical protein
MMKKIFIFTLAFLVISVCGAGAAAQFPLKIPKIKVEKPKPEQPKPASDSTLPETPGRPAEAKTSVSKQVYGFERVPARPVLLKHTVYVQTEMSRTFWKMPKESDYTSWVPKVRFSIYYDWNTPVNYTAEYSNPDGSVWFSETLEGGNRDNERIISFQSGRATSNQMLETKGSVGTGVYGVKIVNRETNETVFQGKFKTAKFLRPYSERTPNRFAFFVEHDWVLPMAYVGFPFSSFIYPNENVGGFPVIVGVWLKGDVNDDELEARLFYRGQQIAVRRFGRTDGRFWADRASEFAAIAPEPPVWKLWNFQWENFLFDNGGSFNRENFPNAHYADQNPGEYAVRILRAGTPVRELKFTVLPDGRLDDGGFAAQMFLPYHTIMVPAKVTGNLEKWNAASKPEAFYGNSPNGFPLQ